MANRSPHHPLTIVRVKLDLPTLTNESVTTCRVTGENPFAKDPLWQWKETWSWSERKDGLDPIDSLTWLLRIAHDDHPDTQEHLERQVRHSDGWEQLEFFEDR